MLHIAFVVLCIFCFILAAFGLNVSRVSFGWLGMVFLALALFGKVFSPSL